MLKEFLRECDAAKREKVTKKISGIDKTKNECYY